MDKKNQGSLWLTAVRYDFVFCFFINFQNISALLFFLLFSSFLHICAFNLSYVNILQTSFYRLSLKRSTLENRIHFLQYKYIFIYFLIDFSSDVIGSVIRNNVEFFFFFQNFLLITFQIEN